MNFKEALKNLNLVYPDGIAKGFPLWTAKGLEMQNTTLEAFMEVFSKQYNIDINYPKEIQQVSEFFGKYKDRTEKYDSTIALFNENGKDFMYITDALPYNLEKMDKKNKSALISYYYMIRLLDSKQIPMSRDYYISPLLQLNLAIENKDKKYCINYVVKCMKEFCKKINLPVVVLEYDGVKGYSEKVYMVSAINEKGETQTILQCSLLSNELLGKFDISDKFKEKSIFDIGYSQKIFAYLAYNNMDRFGMRMPSIYNYKDIAIVYNEKFNSNTIKKLLKNNDINEKIYFNNQLGVKKLKKIKNQCLKQGIRIIMVQNIEDGIESFRVYSINKGEYQVLDYQDICDIIANAKEELDFYYYKSNDTKLNDIRECGYGYVSEFNWKGKIV